MEEQAIKILKSVVLMAQSSKHPPPEVVSMTWNFIEDCIVPVEPALIDHFVMNYSGIGNLKDPDRWVTKSGMDWPRSMSPISWVILVRLVKLSSKNALFSARLL